ncbi:BEM_collapsed_G0027930.mRNA.1.CDS.1 [Saccharomyces cerevisiae]|nr:BDN_1c_G0026890.mRNA.1.CDS.1 [Saccharomyces cerevisiae]CAI4959937.1 BEM_HP_G0150860.mRNA.1.CDS.1 [Saccharomyces cerevisiae]CAI4976558.1 BEM_HP_G0162820.mRNA.1.CDS.1 [Saccharomyces cerevisiae]CAI4987220.1 BEM_HP_G0170550.mRNA.1.CDS.1 [Saccharomyces cerevisiae]CAI5190389.1 BEM_HP_G0093200.mRNA.1.CDS.1 [Saccharomyces cerevisiae]
MVLRNSVLRTAPVLRRGITTLTPVSTKLAPPAAASYSQAMKANNFVYVSGQIPYTPDNKPVQGSISEKAEQVFQNVKNILAESNSSLDNIVKVNVFLADMKNFAEFNSVYAKHFHTHKPARSCVGVASLPLNVDLEMEVIAVEKN